MNDVNYGFKAAGTAFEKQVDLTRGIMADLDKKKFKPVRCPTCWHKIKKPRREVRLVCPECRTPWETPAPSIRQRLLAAYRSFRVGR